MLCFVRGSHLGFQNHQNIRPFTTKIPLAIMSEYFKFLRQLLALSGESFKEELRHLVISLELLRAFIRSLKFLKETTLIKFTIQGFSMTQLTPLEVLSSIQHAQLRLNREFTKEEFLEGKVSGFMLPEVTVSTFKN